MPLESLEYTDVPTILAANTHKEIHTEYIATSFFFRLAVMLQSILLQRLFFPLSAPWTVCLLSFYTPPLPLSLSHPIKSLRVTFKAICSLSLPPPLSQGWYPKPAPYLMPAPISQLLMWWANSFQFFPHHRGKDSCAYHRATAWVSFKFLF